MTTSTLLSGKAGAAKKVDEMLKSARRLYSTGQSPAASNGSHPQSRPTDTAAQRELFMDVLSANATKRDAKQYLARFNAPKKGNTPTGKLSPLQEQRNARHRNDQDRLDRLGVNLGGLYSPARAIADSPQFTRELVDEKTTPEAQQKTIHAALVCLREPQKLDDATLEGVALTLSQLVKLDMHLAVVLDCKPAMFDIARSKAEAAHQGERVTRALARQSRAGARLVHGAVELSASGDASVVLPKLVLEPLKRGIVPLVPTLAYTPAGKLMSASTPTVMSALTRLLSGPSSSSGRVEPEPPITASLDRIIVLDPIGGIPSKARGDGSHVFVNLEQEAKDINAELADRHNAGYVDGGDATIYAQHQENLRISQECLKLLPSASSALIITPHEAANSSQTSNKQDSTIGTGTRRQKNTLIHNLLTNKPLVSSSLPTARIPSAPATRTSPDASAMPTATLLKRGMPLTIIPPIPPGHGTRGWQPPSPGARTLDLATDPRVDLPRLVHLIEDSFRRKLDVEHYLARIRGRTAGLIIAGDYEGGAILTWEAPPPSNTSTTDHATPPVPYLDKFAVLSSSQGSSGVADIVFQAMVRTCFPQGVCWRSRADNPVNKWYFERSAGTWRIPGSNWMMFWTGEGVVEREQRWREYVGVCEGVRPSWADGGSRRPD